MGHNHLELEKEIEKYTTEQITKNRKCFLGVLFNFEKRITVQKYV